MTEDEKKARRNELRRIRRAANPEKVRLENKIRSEYKKKWWSENIERLRPARVTRAKEYYQQNKDRLNAKARKWQTANRERVRATQARWVKKNPDRAREVERKFRTRMMDDPNYRLVKNMRIRICKAIAKKSQKYFKSFDLLGCSLEDFRIYLESRFEPGMAWENYGKVWHVDHIMPCAIFDLTKREHQKRCFHFSNQQPLFVRDNLIKSDSVITNQYPLL